MWALLLQLQCNLFSTSHSFLGMKHNSDPSVAAQSALADQLDEVIADYTGALNSGDWAQLASLDRTMKDLVERALDTASSGTSPGALPEGLASRLQALAELNQRALALTTAEREKIADQLQELANAKAGAIAYAENSKL